MLFFDLLRLFCAFVEGSASDPALGDEFVTLERRAFRSKWTKQQRISSEQVLPVRIALAQSGIEDAAEHLMAISDPTSSDFGKHWNVDEVARAFAPSSETIRTTTLWLEGAGIAQNRIHQGANGGYLAFDATTQELEYLLNTEYYDYSHVDKGHWTVGCDSYQLPSYIASHIDHITPAVGSNTIIKKSAKPKRLEFRTECSSADDNFDPSSFTNLNPNNISICNEWITPACIQALYDLPPPNGSHPNNSFGIAEFAYSFIQSDMDLYFEYVATNIPQGTTPQLDLINGASLSRNINESEVTQESNLDFQSAWPLVYPLNISLLEATSSTAQNNTPLPPNVDASTLTTLSQVDFMDDILTAIDGSYCSLNPGSECGSFVAPYVLSFSYAADETGYSPAMEARLCDEFLKLGLQGTTVVVGSGDHGVLAASGTCLGPDNSTFNTNAIASCPWVTAVGATQIGENQTVHDPESVGYAELPNFFFNSGGGFSNYHPAPAYQQAAVAQYLYQKPPPYPSYIYNGSDSSIGANGGRFNRQGRAYPDVSANGAKFLTMMGGCATHEYGTSASAPVFASIIARINNERLMAGKGPVGFINPTLYANPSVLTDIYLGHNAGCGTDGFAAVTGWDPVTGLGTPNYPRLLSLFMSLP